MKNERATAQFHAARVFRAMTGALFRLMDIHRAQLRTHDCILAQVPSERLRKERVLYRCNRTTAMTYRTYSGPRGSQAIAPLEKDRLLYKEFDTLDGALAWARHVNDGGRVALLIEGDDGTHLGKQEIAGALHHREAPPR
jgi:hypothetical protein